MFSIIVPSYNRKDEIPHLLESLVQQKNHNFEVVIVDDFSKEPVTLEKTYPFDVIVIRNTTNLGAACSRNVGVQNAKNEWILFLDDDDRFTSEKTSVLQRVIAENAEINFLYHPAECVMVNENFSYFTHPSQEKEVTLDNILKANKVGGMPMIGIKKSLFLKVGGFATDLRSLEDYDFILKVISDNEFKPKYVDKALTICTFHTQRSSVSTDTTNTEKAIAYIQKKYVKTAMQSENFKFNSLYMLAYPHIMNLSRNAAKYYFLMFKQSRSIKYAIVALITLISPKLAINLKRFI